LTFTWRGGGDSVTGRFFFSCRGARVSYGGRVKIRGGATNKGKSTDGRRSARCRQGWTTVPDFKKRSEPGGGHWQGARPARPTGGPPSAHPVHGTPRGAMAGPDFVRGKKLGVNGDGMIGSLGRGSPLQPVNSLEADRQKRAPFEKAGLTSGKRAVESGGNVCGVKQRKTVLGFLREETRNTIPREKSPGPGRDEAGIMSGQRTLSAWVDSRVGE